MTETSLASVFRRGGLPALATAVLCLGIWSSALAQAASRAEPVTGPDVTTIGNISADARVSARSRPTALLPVIGTLGYGARVRPGLCLGNGTARWCQIDAVDGSVSGFVSERYLVTGAARPPGDGFEGAPDYWAVRGLPAGARLNVRRDPAATSPALATLREGEVVRDLGCRMSGGARWCRIRLTTGMDVTGWVAGRCPRERAPPAAPRPPQGGGQQGPIFYVVTGLASGDTLNLRAQPSAQQRSSGGSPPGRGCAPWAASSADRRAGAGCRPPAA